MMGERDYWVAFSVFPGIGPVRFKLLLEYFGSAQAAWKAPTATLKKIRLGESLTERFNHFRRTFDLPAYLNKLATNHVGVLTLTDRRYPQLLAQIADAPFVLYVKGRKTRQPLDLGRTIAVVGTRKITKYGQEVTGRLVTELVARGLTIVSGLAYGVDAAAHQAALEAGGKTVAVLGCGIDIMAPPSNAKLYWNIANGGGAIVSEMPLGLRPTRGLFPARNRIISGLSLGVVVIEGAEDSGALITARFAAEQGREVFAVPGPITSIYSRGPAKLLKSGAKLVETAQDILEELKITSKTITHGNQQEVKGETKEEQQILGFLADRQIHVDELVRLTNLTIARVAATLTLLEIKGSVKDYGGKTYGLTN